jgi:sodium/potassium-transporting ATPase subunit beta
LKAFDKCTSAKKFGYEEGKPCIFLKLNKIYNWAPDYYKDSNDLNDLMPESLKAHIKKYGSDRKNSEVVWVSCEGENPADIENLGTDVKYYSLGGEQGFLGTYFPYINTQNYLQPLVAVQFNSVKRKFNLFKK